MKKLLLIFISSLCFANYDSDLKNINRMGEHADSLLSKYGFAIEDGNTSHPDKKNAPSSRQLFRVHGDLSTNQIPAGSLSFGTLYTRLVIGGEDSPAIVNITNGNIGWLRGLRLLGKARQSSTQGRVNIEFDRLLLKNGKTVKLDAAAMDSSGALGLEAEVFSSKALMLAGSMMGSFLSGYATSQQTSTSNGFGFSQTQTSGRNSLLQGVAQTAADQSKRLIEDATQEKPVLVLSPGTPVSILFKEGISI